MQIATLKLMTKAHQNYLDGRANNNEVEWIERILTKVTITSIDRRTMALNFEERYFKIMDYYLYICEFFWNISIIDE